MAPSKRARTQTTTSASKKARVVDPLEVVMCTLADPECQVEGGEAHREMFLAAVPHALTVPCDERHEYQTAMVKMVEVVLRASVADWEAKVSIAQSKVDWTEQQSAQDMKDVEASASRVQAQEEAVARCQEVFRVDSEAAKTSQEALEVATKEVADFDSNLQGIIEEKEQCSSVYNECFVHLKSEAVVSKEVQQFMKRMEPMLKTLGTEPSMLSAVAPALKKAPTERGPFDVMAIEGIDAVFTKHLGSLQEQIDQADVLKAQKVAAQGVAQEALEVAKGKEAASEKVLKEAEEVQSSLEAQHAEFNRNIDCTSNMEAIAEHGVKEESLAKARQALTAFTELFERTSIVPSAVDEALSKAEVMAESVCEPMECVEAA